MPGSINYKSKYMELRAKYLNDLDMAFRLGFEQGAQQAQNDQAAQQAQQQQEMDAAAQGAPGDGGMGDEAPPIEGEAQPMVESEHPEGSELDQHIAKLEEAIAKSEDANLKKSLEDMKAFRKKELLGYQLKKNEKAISAIAKALHKPAFKLSKQASINLNDNAKRAVTLQHKIVEDVMNKMEQEEKRASKSIQDLLVDLVKE
jgi:hypothetical protein